MFSEINKNIYFSVLGVLRLDFKILVHSNGKLDEKVGPRSTRGDEHINAKLNALSREFTNKTFNKVPPSKSSSSQLVFQCCPSSCQHGSPSSVKPKPPSVSQPVSSPILISDDD